MTFVVYKASRKETAESVLSNIFARANTESKGVSGTKRFPRTPVISGGAPLTSVIQLGTDMDGS